MVVYEQTRLDYISLRRFTPMVHITRIPLPRRVIELPLEGPKRAHKIREKRRTRTQKSVIIYQFACALLYMIRSVFLPKDQSHFPSH